MSDQHARGELGAYVLGGLTPAERRQVEAHVRQCTPCRDELSELSVLPTLLDRLTPDEATGALSRPAPVTPPPPVPDPAAEAAPVAPGDGEDVELRRSLRRWRMAAAAAGLAAVVAGGALLAPLVGTSDGPPDATRADLAAVAGDAGEVTGVATAYAWDWGTTINLEVAHLPQRDRYVIWVVDGRGRELTAGTWGPTADRAATVRSATAVARTDIARIEVRDDDGAVLLTADLPGS